MSEEAQVYIWSLILTSTADKTVVITPKTILPWLRQRLESSGVRFRRMTFSSLSEVKVQGHDVLVNATGGGPKFLEDIRDDNVQLIRGQTLHVKSNYDKIFIRHGKDYTYVLPRLDGTAILGGIKQEGMTDAAVDWDIQRDVSQLYSLGCGMILTSC